VGVPQQIPRLVVVFAVAVVGLLIVRRRLIPESFGVMGPYRAEAVTAIAARSSMPGISLIVLQLVLGTLVPRLAMAIGILLLPLLILWPLVKLLPPWQEAALAPSR